jgi:hypothetical protein
VRRFALVLALTLPSLAFAPAPLPRRERPTAGTTEVVVEVVGGFESITVTFGKRKVRIDLDGPWGADLSDWLRRFRDGRPSPRLLTLRCDQRVLTPTEYIHLRRLCQTARYPKLRVLDPKAPP